MEHNPDKLTPEQVGVSEGWRLLDKKEIIDREQCGGVPFGPFELWSIRHGGYWMRGIYYADSKVCTYRTKLSRAELRAARNLSAVEPAPVKMDAEYRMLEAGEVVQDGDEWHFTIPNKWVPAQEARVVGLKLHKLDFGSFRRPIARNLPPEVTEESEDVLICGSHRNQASRLLGKSYRTKTNPPNDFPSIGAVEVNNAVDVLSVTLAELSAARAEVEELKRERDEEKARLTEVLTGTQEGGLQWHLERYNALLIQMHEMARELSAAQAALKAKDDALTRASSEANRLNNWHNEFGSGSGMTDLIQTLSAALDIQLNEQEEGV